MMLAISASAANVLCIGLNEYASYDNLNCAENDATQMAKIFKSLGHETTLLTKKNVTRESVLAALQAKPDVVFFAGHGEVDHLVVADGKVLLSEVSTACAGSVVLLDCCYAGNNLKKSGETKFVTAAEYEAFESDGSGLFSKYLSKWVADGNSVSADDMNTYLRKNLSKESGGWQKPVVGYM